MAWSESTPERSAIPDGLPKTTLAFFGQSKAGILRVEGSLHGPFRPTRLTGDFRP